jgi:putative tryptophan/tyrosine transport system substrate-binding protein
MHRRRFVQSGLVGASALARTPSARAQQPERVVRIGMLSTSFGQRADGIRAFKARLKALGYTEGENLVIEMRDGEGRNDRVSAFAADLVERRVDLIVPLGPYAIGAAKAATATIPIVFTGIGTNFPLARSEGNTTGVAEELVESTTGRLALLKEAVPSLARVGVIGNPGNYGTPAYLEKCRAWAQAAGAALQVYDLRDPNDTAPIFAKMADDRVEALIAFPDSVIFGQRDNIVQSALRGGLPGVYLYREWVAAGGLLAYGPNQASILGGPLPAMVDKILKGAKPGDLPVEHGKLELFVNRATARSIRIELPHSLLSRADEVLG